MKKLLKTKKLISVAFIIFCISILSVNLFVFAQTSNEVKIEEIKSLGKTTVIMRFEVASETNGETRNAEISNDFNIQLRAKAFELIKAETELENSSGKQVDSKFIIEIPKEEGETAVSFSMPCSLFNDLGEFGIDKIEVSTGIATAAVDAGSFYTIDAQNLTFNFSKVDSSLLTDTQKSAVGDNAVYDFNLKIKYYDGRETLVSNLAKHICVTTPYSIKVDENPEKVTVVFLNNDGSIEPAAGRYDAETKDITVYSTIFSKYTVKENNISFIDIDDSWAKKYIEIMASKGIIKGMHEDMYGAGIKVTRAQFASMLVRAFNIDVSKACISCRFKDGDRNAWYAKDVMSVVAAGLMNGYADRSFKPNDFITRQEMAAVAARAAKVFKNALVPESFKLDYKDNAKIAEYAKESIKLSAKYEILTGRPGGYFDPDGFVTRAEAAKIIYQIYNIK